MRPICVRLDDESEEKLSQKAAAVGVNRSDYLRDLILRDLREPEKAEP